MPLRLVSWNVNGIRSCVRKGFLDWLGGARADVVGLQETRAELDDLPAELLRQRRYRHCLWSPARSKRGYSGTALLLRHEPLRVVRDLGAEEFDREGRFVLAELPNLLVANAYFPKGSGNLRDNSRVPYKLAFTRHVFDFVLAEARRTAKPAVLMGDFNIAPTEIDLARPRGNEQTSGFLPEERALYAECLASGFSDSYRLLHPDRIQYSWWSNRFGVREKNIGWRIDHVLITQRHASAVRRAFILDQVRGSDHCPVGVDLRLADGARDG
jgi:exodeoxyribonuclease-3